MVAVLAATKGRRDHEVPDHALATEERHQLWLDEALRVASPGALDAHPAALMQIQGWV